MQKNKKTIILGVLLFVFLLAVASAIMIFAKQRNEILKARSYVWQTYDKKVDYVTKDGRLIRDDSRSRGITILPLNYEEKKIQYKITSYSFADKTEKTHIIFDSLPEFTEVKLTPNSIDGSKIWVVTLRGDKCFDEVVNTKARDCKFMLYEYNLDTDSLIEKQELRYYVGTPVRDVYLLAHDPLKNIVWIGVDYQIKAGEVSQWKSELPDLVDLSRSYFGTDLVGFDANSNKGLGITKTSYWMSSRFNPIHKTLADTGKDGELYFIGECDLKCGDRKYINEGVAVAQNNKTTPLPNFYYGQDLGPARYFQITTDTKNNYVYIVTKSFDQNKPSNIFRYDDNTGRSFHIGKQPTQYDDDVRGLDVIDGNLAIGSFNGLAVYNGLLDKWIIIKKDNGLKSNNVEGVYGIDGGEVCVLHENEGASCLLKPLSEYISSFKKQ